MPRDLPLRNSSRSNDPLLALKLNEAGAQYNFGSHWRASNLIVVIARLLEIHVDLCAEKLLPTLGGGRPAWRTASYRFRLCLKSHLGSKQTR